MVAINPAMQAPPGQAERLLALEAERKRVPNAYPSCTHAINCGTPNSGNVNRAPHGLYWMPVGSFRTPFGFYFNVAQIKSLNEPLTQVVPDAGPSSSAYDAALALTNYLYEFLPTRFTAVINRSLGRNNYGQVVSDNDLSLNAFMQKHPDFVIEYVGFKSRVPPTADELTRPRGVYAYVRRGGWLVSKRVLDGEENLREFVPSACAVWCRGCVTDFWPNGVPTCSKEIKIETEGFDWGFHVKRRFLTAVGQAIPTTGIKAQTVAASGIFAPTAAAGSSIGPTATAALPSNPFVSVAPALYTTTPNARGVWIITIKRRPKTTWEKIDHFLANLPLNDFVNWLCKTHSSPEGQMAVAYANSTKDAYSKASLVAFDQVLRSGCPKPVLPSGQVGPPLPEGEPPAITPPAAPPAVRQFPAGAIAYFEPKTSRARIAIPRGLAGTAATHVEVAVIPMADKPRDVPVVSVFAWEAATRPWYSRRAVVIPAGVGAVALTGGLVWFLRRRSRTPRR